MLVPRPGAAGLMTPPSCAGFASVAIGGVHPSQKSLQVGVFGCFAPQDVSQLAASPSGVLDPVSTGWWEQISLPPWHFGVREGPQLSQSSGFKPRSPHPEPGTVRPLLGITGVKSHLTQVLPGPPSAPSPAGSACQGNEGERHSGVICFAAQRTLFVENR